MAKPIVADFTKAEGSSRIRIPEDDYRVEVESVKQQESKAGNQMLVWNFVITEGKHKGKVLVDRTTLTDASIWKLKQLLEAMGITVPSKRVALNLKRYPGKELGVTVVDDEYEGRVSSKVADYISVDVLDDTDVDEEDEDEDEEEDEEPVAKKKSKKGKKSKRHDEDEEVEDIDLDEL